MGREEGGGSGWRTHVYLWRIHFDIWQNQYNIVKFKNKIKKNVLIVMAPILINKVCLSLVIMISNSGLKP